MLRLIPVLAACALCQGALAQSVFKCTVDGKIEYGDRPCARGQVVALNVPPAPGPGAASPASRERAALLELEKMRLARELQQERARVSAEREARAEARERRAADSQRRRCGKLRLRQKWADEDRARLTGAALEQARIKARREAETLAVECPA